MAACAGGGRAVPRAAPGVPARRAQPHAVPRQRRRRCRLRARAASVWPRSSPRTVAWPVACLRRKFYTFAAEQHGGRRGPWGHDGRARPRAPGGPSPAVPRPRARADGLPSGVGQRWAASTPRCCCASGAACIGRRPRRDAAGANLYGRGRLRAVPRPVGVAQDACDAYGAARAVRAARAARQGRHGARRSRPRCPRARRFLGDQKAAMAGRLAGRDRVGLGRRHADDGGERRTMNDGERRRAADDALCDVVDASPSLAWPEAPWTQKGRASCPRPAGPGSPAPGPGTATLPSPGVSGLWEGDGRDLNDVLQPGQRPHTF